MQNNALLKLNHELILEKCQTIKLKISLPEERNPIGRKVQKSPFKETPTNEPKAKATPVKEPSFIESPVKEPLDVSDNILQNIMLLLKLWQCFCITHTGSHSINHPVP